MDTKKLWRELPDFLRNPDPELLLTDDYMVIDFETTNIDNGSPYNLDNHIVCATWCRGNSDVYYHKGSEFDQENSARDVENARLIVAHNTKFEIGWLERMGVDTSNKLFFCTQIAEYVLWGNQPKGQMQSLDKCLGRRGMGQKNPLVSMLIKGKICPSEIPESWLREYALQDTFLTRKLFLNQRKALASGGLLPVALTRNLVTPVLVDLERTGLSLDRERVQKSVGLLSTKLDSLQTKWEEMVGGINTNSPAQKRELLFETLKFDPPKNYRGKPIRTPGGELSTSEKVISKLRARNKKQEQFLGLFKSLNKTKQMKQKFLDKLQECCEQSGGILLAVFNQTITATHRLSSNGALHKIQIQNIARKLKPLFKARNDGWYVAEIDSDGLEFRIGIHLGRDEQGKEDLASGRDPHAYSASIVFRSEYNPEIGAKEGSNAPLRQNAKAHTFKPLYGGGSGTEDEVAYYDAFKERYYGITEAQERWKISVFNHRELTTETGLTFYWPDAKITKWGDLDFRTQHQICNYPVQNLATAEIVPVSLVYQWHLMRAAKLQSFLVNTVHDSTIGEVHPDEREDYKLIAEACFTTIVTWYLKKVYGIELFVPLSATVEYNTHWSESDKWVQSLVQ